MGKVNKRKALAISTADFLLFIGAGAIVCGMLFIIRPDGSRLSMTVDLLKDSPFKDFFIPGITLVAANGILSIIAALLLFLNYRHAGFGVMILGAVMLIWIAAQVYWIGWQNWLQPAFLAVGVLELLIGFVLEAKYHDNWGRFGSNHDSHAH
jgi:hypothetical protein